MAQTNLESIWKETEDQLLVKGRKSNESFKILEGKRRLLDKIKGKTIGIPQEYIKVFSGMIRREDIEELKRFTDLSKNACKEFIYDFSNKLRKQFHDEIWKARCETVIDMEKTLGIAKKNKRTAQNKDNKQDLLKIKNSKKRRKKSSPNKDRISEQDAAVYSSIIDKIDL